MSVIQSWVDGVCCNESHFEVDSITHGDESANAKAAPGSARALARVWKRIVDNSDARLATESDRW